MKKRVKVALVVLLKAGYKAWYVPQVRPDKISFNAVCC